MHGMRWLGGLALMAGVSAAVLPAHRLSPAQAPERVAGSWKLVSAKANGKAVDFPAGTTILKHLTPTDFIFVHYDAKARITVAGGGRYRLNGARYEETVDYGLGEAMAPLIGKTHVFSARIENGRWYRGGTEATAR